MQTISPSWAVVLLGSRPFSQSTMLLLRNSGSKSIQRRRKWCASVQIMISLLMISDSKNVERFKYLGSYVNRNCNLNAEITARIQAASNSYDSLKLQVFDNRDLTENTKISVYKQCILSIFLYWSETWTLYSDEIKQLCTVQQRHLQSILKIRWNTLLVMKLSYLAQTLKILKPCLPRFISDGSVISAAWKIQELWENYFMVNWLRAHVLLAAWNSALKTISKAF